MILKEKDHILLNSPSSSSISGNMLTSKDGTQLTSSSIPWTQLICSSIQETQLTSSNILGSSSIPGTQLIWSNIQGTQLTSEDATQLTSSNIPGTQLTSSNIHGTQFSIRENIVNELNSNSSYTVPISSREAILSNSLNSSSINIIAMESPNINDYEIDHKIIEKCTFVEIIPKSLSLYDAFIKTKEMLHPNIDPPEIDPSRKAQYDFVIQNVQKWY